MTIEQSHLQLSAQSSLFREQVRVRLVSAAAPPAKVLAKQASTQATPAFDLDSAPQGKLLLMRLIAEMMLGTRIHLFHAPSKGAPVAVPAPNANAPQPQVQSMQVRVEAEQLRFAAKGTVETADGMRIDFQVDLALSRRFVEVVVGDGAASAKQDPLILNFDGTGVRLLADRISFDLNGDGQSESMPVVAPGSGILFADRNGDGVATNGAELFGPKSGDGFNELAALDTDLNGWIDQGDPVFGELRVWFQDAAGPGTAYNLADLGVGAISTSSVGTPFDLRTSENVLLGQIRRSGVYLRENGQPGIVSHVDLSV